MANNILLSQIDQARPLILTPEQLNIIDNSILNFTGQPFLYRNISGSEHFRLTDEMFNAPIGTILEAYPSLSDALTNANRRYFWKKTALGIFQVTTTNTIDSVQSVVFNP